MREIGSNETGKKKIEAKDAGDQDCLESGVLINVRLLKVIVRRPNTSSVSDHSGVVVSDGPSDMRIS